MGGKREMLTDIHNALAAMDVKSETLCDLFAGTSVVAYAMSDEYDLVVNDIQHYSEIFAKCYMNDYSHIQNIDESVNIIKEKIIRLLQLDVLWKDTDALRYNEDMNYQDMLAVEAKECEIIEGREEERGFSLFKRCYSGTYWSYEQCRHIDAIRAVCEQYRGNCLYEAMMASLIYAMSYSSQSTGHFAQYRTLTEKNYQDILQYRMKNVFVMFLKKLKELLTTLRRFYHVLETLVRYDNPKVEYKGRYRENRYQSPFDQRSKAKDAFKRLFQKIDQQQCHLLLSYSDNAMLTLTDLQEIAHNVFGNRYEYKFYSKDYQHMKMARNDVARLDVHEILLSFKRI